MMSAPPAKRRKYSDHRREAHLRVFKPGSIDTEQCACTLPNYEYQPLRGEDEIRILKVEGAGASKWSYRIEHTTLNEAPPFETVSYVWGLETRRHILYLDGNTTLHINDNLNKALPYLSSKCTTGYLWIDQVCINQSSTQERNHQVKLMGSIYKKGVGVWAWLGVGRPFSQPMLELIQITRLSIQLRETASLLRERLERQLVMASSQLLNAICQVLQNEWFSRAWVFQEIVLPNHATFLVGYATIPFLVLAWISRVAESCPRPSLTGIDSTNSITQASSSPQQARYVTIKNTHGYQILTIMHRTRSIISRKLTCYEMPFTWLLSKVSSISNTSDRRDSVYAFLGLQLDCSIDIEPNYNSTYEESLHDTAVSIIRGSGSLDILAYSNRRQSPESSSVRLPSWVPDWSVPSYSPLLMTSRHDNQLLRSSHRHSWLESKNPAELRVRGVRVDVISKIFEPAFRYQKENWFEEDLQNYLSLDQRLEDVRKLMACTREDLLTAIMALNFRPDVEYRHFDEFYDRSSTKGFLNAYDEYVEMGKEPCNTAENKMLRGLRYYTHLANTRYLYKTRGGHLGLVSRPCDGAIICNIEGCYNLIALESCGTDRFSIVGACHLQRGKRQWDYINSLWSNDKAEEFILV